MLSRPGDALRDMINVKQPQPRRDFGQMSMSDTLMWQLSAPVCSRVTLCMPGSRPAHRRRTSPWPPFDAPFSRRPAGTGPHAAPADNPDTPDYVTNPSR